MADIIAFKTKIDEQEEEINSAIIKRLEELLESAKKGDVTDLVVTYFVATEKKFPVISFVSNKPILMLGALDVAKQYIKSGFNFKG